MATALVALGVVALVRRDGDGTGDPAGGPGRAEQDRLAAQGYEVVREAPEVPPFELGPAPVWGSAPGSPKPGPFGTLHGVAVRGPSAVLWGGEGFSPGRLSVVDLATGDERWGLGVTQDLPGHDAALFDPSSMPLSFDGSAHRPAVVDTAGGGWAVGVAYLDAYHSGLDAVTTCDYLTEACPPLPTTTNDVGVAALAGDDGRVLWRTTVASGAPPGQLSVDTVVAVVGGGDLLLAVVGPSAPRSEGPGTGADRVVALDAATGEVRWERPGVWPVGATSDTVVGLAGAVPGDPLLDDEGATVVALDKATGEPRWERPASFPWRMEHPVVGDVVVVEVRGGDERADGTEVLVLEAGSGDEVVGFGPLARDCHSDGEALVACAVYVGDERYRLASYRVGDELVGVSERAVTDLFVEGVWRDGAFVTRWDVTEEDDPSEPRSLIDLAGHEVADGVPGTVVAGSDDHVVVACGRIGRPCPGAPSSGTGDTYAVYRVAPPGDGGGGPESETGG